MEILYTFLNIILFIVQLYIIFKILELFSRVKKLEKNQEEIIFELKKILGIENKNDDNEVKEEFSKPQDWLK